MKTSQWTHGSRYFLGVNVEKMNISAATLLMPLFYITQLFEMFRSQVHIMLIYFSICCPICRLDFCAGNAFCAFLVYFNTLLYIYSKRCVFQGEPENVFTIRAKMYCYDIFHLHLSGCCPGNWVEVHVQLRETPWKSLCIGFWWTLSTFKGVRVNVPCQWGSQKRLVSATALFL